MPLVVEHEITEDTAHELRCISQRQARCLACGGRGTETTLLTTGQKFFRCGPVPPDSIGPDRPGCGCTTAWKL